jgi:tRNA pseudouridine-54 N-methylase
MKFLVVSQRAIPNPNFRLNDLTAHGRIDVLIRCILAACRPLIHNKTNTIYCYLKGSDEPTEWGWISWDTSIENHDEPSFAATIQKKWNDIFKIGSLEECLQDARCTSYIYLHEDGTDIDEYKIVDKQNLVVLGAQSDLNDDDLEIIKDHTKIKLSESSMLASQAIIFMRQKLISKDYFL